MSQLGLQMDEESDGGSGRGRRAKQQQRRQRRRRRRSVVTLLLVLVVVGSIGGGLYVAGGAFVDKAREVLGAPADYTGQSAETVMIEIKPGDTTRAIGTTLQKADIVKSTGAFVDAAGSNAKAATIQPGFYTLNKKVSGASAVEMLLSPAARNVKRATVPEGRRLGQTITALAKGSGLAEADLTAALKDPAAVGLPAWANGNAEGFLFPATYEVNPNTTPADLIKAMTAKFGQVSAATGLEQGLNGLSPLQVLTVASIVQAEGGKDTADLPKIARVVYNRLDKGMQLQLDTTVNFATGKFGVTTTSADRASDSPYNTYKVKGLPPGPIDSPGRQAIEAALHPAEGTWLYFVATNPTTGETKFATTAAEHAANVKEFQQWLKSNPQG